LFTFFHIFFCPANSRENTLSNSPARNLRSRSSSLTPVLPLERSSRRRFWLGFPLCGNKIAERAGCASRWNERQPVLERGRAGVPCPPRLAEAPAKRVGLREGFLSEFAGQRGRCKQR